MNDVPDVAGDKQGSVRCESILSQCWPRRVLKRMMRLRTSSFCIFGIGFVSAAFSSNAVLPILSRITIETAAFVGAASLKAAKICMDASFMHLRNLFYVSYVLLPLAR